MKIRFAIVRVALGRERWTRLTMAVQSYADQMWEARRDANLTIQEREWYDNEAAAYETLRQELKG
jgi:hypothetical protein